MAVSRRLILVRGLVGVRAGPLWGGGKLHLSDSDRHQRCDFSDQDGALYSPVSSLCGAADRNDSARIFGSHVILNDR